MLLKLNIIALSIALLFLPKEGFSQEVPLRPNHIDGNGNKNGDWVYYYDSDWNILESGTNVAFYRLITYKDGKPIGQVAD